MKKIFLIFMILISCNNNKEMINNNEKSEQNKTISEKNIDKNDKNQEINSKNNGVYYEIFVRSFADSNGDGIGDLRGIIENLDYLNDGIENEGDDLEVKGIWLMPITKSPSYHKYDVENYFEIDPEYGTMEDFKELIKEANNRGIKVIMDLVINHTSTSHPWFIEAKKNENSEYRDYYRFVKEDENIDFNKVVWNHKIWNKIEDSYYFALFWDQMPDLNFESEKLRKEIKNIAKFWLENGVHGFRLDAAMHIYHPDEYSEDLNFNNFEKNNQWWREFREACESINKNVYIVGEIWENASKVAGFYENMDSNFNFDFSEGGIIKVVNTGNDSINFSEKLYKIHEKYREINKNFIDAPFITNHDQNRSMSAFLNDTDKMKIASNLLLTMPGNPFIYYGEEIGMLGSKPDEEIREPFKWNSKYSKQATKWIEPQNNKETLSVEEQQKDKNSLLNHYKKMIRIRNSSKALTKGKLIPYEENNKKLISFFRETENDKALVIHNISKDEQELKIDDIKLENEIYKGEGIKVFNNTIIIPSRESYIVNVK